MVGQIGHIGTIRQKLGVGGHDVIRGDVVTDRNQNLAGTSPAIA